MLGFGNRKSGAGGWLATSRPSAPIAADFGRSSIRLLQLAPGSGSYRCNAAAEIPGAMLDGSGPTLDPGTMAARIQDAIRGLGFGGRRIAATLPAELFQSDIARLPAMDDRELAESVRYEAMDRFGIEGDSSVIGHLRLGATAGGSNEVLMLAIARSTVERAAAALSGPDTLAFRVEHAALSALRAVTRQRTSECADPADARDYALIHLEDRVATLVILREGNVAFLRGIRGDWAPVAVTALRRTRTGRTAIGTSGDAISLGGDPSEGSTAWRWCALAEESLRCLRHFERTAGQWRPREIVITGPAAVDPECAATVESVCGTPASLAVPIRMIESPEACIHGNPWIAAIGSACAELPALARNVRPEPASDARPEGGPRTRAGSGSTISLAPEPKPLTVHGPPSGAAA